MLIPVVAALIALVAALAGFTMVKFYGVIFLGQPREAARRAHDAGLWNAPACSGSSPAASRWGCCRCSSSSSSIRRHRQLVGAGLGTRGARQGWLAAGADEPSARATPPGDLPAGIAAPSRWPPDRAALPRPHAPRAGLGLRLPAGRRRAYGTRPKASASRSGRSSSLLRDDARTADALRRRAALPRHGRRPLLAGSTCLSSRAGRPHRRLFVLHPAAGRIADLPCSTASLTLVVLMLAVAMSPTVGASHRGSTAGDRHRACSAMRRCRARCWRRFPS